MRLGQRLPERCWGFSHRQGDVIGVTSRGHPPVMPAPRRSELRRGNRRAPGHANYRWRLLVARTLVPHRVWVCVARSWRGHDGKGGRLRRGCFTGRHARAEAQRAAAREQAGTRTRELSVACAGREDLRSAPCLGARRIPSSAAIARSWRGHDGKSGQTRRRHCYLPSCPRRRAQAGTQARPTPSRCLPLLLCRSPQGGGARYLASSGFALELPWRRLRRSAAMPSGRRR